MLFNQIALLKNNSFSGTIDLSQIPLGIEELELSGNEISMRCSSDELCDNIKIIQRHAE